MRAAALIFGAVEAVAIGGHVLAWPDLNYEPPSQADRRRRGKRWARHKRAQHRRQHRNRFHAVMHGVWGGKS